MGQRDMGTSFRHHLSLHHGRTCSVFLHNDERTNWPRDMFEHFYVDWDHCLLRNRATTDDEEGLISLDILYDSLLLSLRQLTVFSLPVHCCRRLCGNGWYCHRKARQKSYLCG